MSGLRLGLRWFASMALLFVLAGALPARGAGLVDPLLRFRTLRTDHFTIYFHQGEQAMAFRLAAIAEDVWRSLRASAIGVPAARTHVVLADQMENANGFATPLPRNLIFLGAQWPDSAGFIGLTDDWLRTVFTHEYAHVAHLDRSVGWAKPVRAIFGRTILAFPNLFLPAWQIEGLATYRESVGTGQGRVHAGNFGAITREPARGGWPEPLDLVNGGLTDWPDGHAQYAYGAGFHAYLATTYGDDKLGELANASAGRFPYTASRVFKPVFGKPLGDLWREYQTDLIDAAKAHEAPGTATRITRTGFVSSGPRFASNAEIVYSLETPHAFPTLNAIAVDGSGDRALTTRYSGSTAAVAGNTIYFDQIEIRRVAGAYADVYALDRTTGRTRALTREARLLDPDSSPDGTSLVCVRNASDRRDLVLVSLSAGAPQVSTLLSEPDTFFNAPRWSPDGRTIAVERHRLWSLSEVVVVDAQTHSVRTVAARADARAVTPAWRPDGTAIVAAIAPRDEVFDLYEFPLDGSTERRLTNVNGGASWPDVSPDGRTIVFVGYTVDGQDLFTIPYPTTGAAGPSLAASTENADTRQRLSTLLPAPPESPYRPWSTLAPTSWFPIIETDSDQTRIGAEVSGVDVLGYHGYAAGLTWLASGPSDATVDRSRPDWFLYYAYSRWQPIVWFSASEATSFFAGPVADDGAPPPQNTARENELELGVAFPVQRARTSHTTTAFIHRGLDEFLGPSDLADRNRTSVRAAWAGTSARRYGYSISQEDGFSVGTTTEFVRPAFGADGESTTVTVDGRAYLPGVRQHHIAALRAGFGASSGDVRMRRTFLLGGPGPNSRLDDFGRDAMSLLRGFSPDSFAGTHVALINADYRLPLLRPQRGAGTWPLFVQTVHAAVFVDAGHTWTRTFRAADIKTSIGAELSVDVVAGYFFPLTVTVGAAAGHDGAAAETGATGYVRIGRAF